MYNFKNTCILPLNIFKTGNKKIKLVKQTITKLNRFKIFKINTYTNTA